MKDVFQDFPAGERVQHLEDNAYKVEETVIKRPFTENQLSVFKDQLSDEMIALNELRSELDAVKKDFKEKMNPAETEVKKLLKNLKYKYEEVEGKVYMFADHAEGTMTYFDEFGKFLESRGLMPHERQTTIVEMKPKTGTHD